MNRFQKIFQTCLWVLYLCASESCCYGNQSLELGTLGFRQVANYQGGSVFQIGNFVVIPIPKSIGRMVPLRLREQVSHESQEFTPPVFDSSRPFTFASQLVKQPTSEKTDAAGDNAAKNDEKSFPKFICRHTLFFGVCFLIGLALGYFYPKRS